MSTIDLNPIISELQNVTDADMKLEIARLGISIRDEKFHFAFSGYGLSNFLSGANLQTLKGEVNIPDPQMNGIRWTGVIVLRGYITFIYMRSEHLERGLDNLDRNSPLEPFKRFFRAGKINKGEDTIAQHIRNSLSHGTFTTSGQMRQITFSDRDWTGTVDTGQFIDGLCTEVYRFYAVALEAKDADNR